MSNPRPMAGLLALALLLLADSGMAPEAGREPAMAHAPSPVAMWKPVCFDECTAPSSQRQAG